MATTKIIKQGFAVYPSVKLYGTVKKTKKWGFIKELLFGDYIKPVIKNNKYETFTDTKGITRIKVRARNADGYILPEQIQANRILEVNFIDIGQGDGCHMVTPKDKHFVIDAGAGDNMFRFMRWRFNLKTAKTAPPVFTGIISHSDADHYSGFNKLFTPAADQKQQLSFDKIYHNGMIEETGSKPDSLGTKVNSGGENYITDLCSTDLAYRKRAQNAASPGTYIKTLNKTTAKIESLKRSKTGTAVFVPNTDDIKLEVLGPFVEKINNKDALPVFEANKGKTKNGHSVILKLLYGKLTMLLGGDLNTNSEDYLLSKYSGSDISGIKKELKKKSLSAAKRAQLVKELDDAVLKSRKYFEVDVAKSCHHGSADFTSEFLKSLNPMATVISSGDDEPHCHPRPDTLGTIGKFSRGERSLIFSTELARSGKEFIDVTKLRGDKKKIRVVTVYGMINLRSDGEKMIIAQKLERAAPGRGWDIHKFEYNNNTKRFEYIMKD